MNLLAFLDRSSLTGMALGIGLILQPWWAGGFRAGFFVTAAAAMLHIITSHMNKPETP
ncbi:MAG TPA: hypothetical protein VM223_08180 [Planctomycetota bacterium]|nr:hypothetical protein [Planctomycetota bacterium]